MSLVLGGWGVMGAGERATRLALMESARALLNKTQTSAGRVAKQALSTPV